MHTKSFSGSEVCEYPDSGKFLATAGCEGQGSFHVIRKLGSSLDYWDGEP